MAPIVSNDRVSLHCLPVFLNLLLISQSFAAIWHPYDLHKKYPDSCSHTSNMSSLPPPKSSNIDAEFIKKYKIWPNLVSKKDLESGETMVGFREGFEAIWDHQHPKDCSKAKFAIALGWEHGFGSETHVLGVALGLAMNMDRVLIRMPSDPNAKQGQYDKGDKWHSQYRFQINNQFCKDQNQTSLDCYYEPWSSCTIQDAIGNLTPKELWSHKHMVNQGQFSKSTKEWGHPERTILLAQADTPSSQIVPAAFKHLVECSPINPQKYRYWWRSVSTAYLLRPNGPTRDLLLKHSKDASLGNFDVEKEHCISVHIRRGDKHVEMPFEDDLNVFFNASRQLWYNVRKNDPTITQNTGIMFLGTEDPGE